MNMQPGSKQRLPLGVRDALTRLVLRGKAPFLENSFPPRGARISDMMALTDVPAGTGFPLVWTPTTRNPGDSQPFEFKVPAASAGTVRAFALDTNNPVGEAYVRFRFVVNGLTKENYQAPPFNIGDVDDPADVYFELVGGDTFRIELANLDTTIPYRVSTRCIVWSWRLPTLLDLAGSEGF